MRSRYSTALTLTLLALTLPVALAGKSDYKKAETYPDDTAWYIGSWIGENQVFEPPLPVEITILPSGEVYSFIHGQSKAYTVQQGGKTVKIKKLKDREVRGKMLNPKKMILEDGGKLAIAQTDSGLETIVAELDLIVQYIRPTDPGVEAAIEERAAAQQEKEAHHKDHDFWHSEAFWGAVAVGATSAVTDHDDHVKIETPTISKSDADALAKAYPK